MGPRTDGGSVMAYVPPPCGARRNADAPGFHWLNVPATKIAAVVGVLAGTLRGSVPRERPRVAASAAPTANRLGRLMGAGAPRRLSRPPYRMRGRRGPRWANPPPAACHA